MACSSKSHPQYRCQLCGNTNLLEFDVHFVAVPAEDDVLYAECIICKNINSDRDLCDYIEEVQHKLQDDTQPSSSESRLSEHPEGEFSVKKIEHFQNKASQLHTSVPLSSVESSVEKDYPRFDEHPVEGFSATESLMESSDYLQDAHYQFHNDVQLNSSGPFSSFESHVGMSSSTFLRYPDGRFPMIETESLKSGLRSSVISRPCPECGNGVPDLFEQVQCPDGSEDPTLLSCMLCKNGLVGMDDTMTVDDLRNLLKDAKIETSACSGCGNTDPDKYQFKKVGDSVHLVCLICSRHHDETGINDERAVDGSCWSSDHAAIGRDHEEIVPESSFSCTCGNRDQDLMKVSCDPQGYPYLIQCIVCEKEFPVEYQLGIICPCGNRNQQDFKYDFRGQELRSCRCQMCKRCFSPKEWLRLAQIPTKTHHSVLPKTRIKDVDDLHVGDHISWQRDEGYWHHAIVTQVGHLSGMVKVVDYTGEPVIGSMRALFSQAEIVEHWIDTDPNTDELYRIDYNPSECYPDHEVLKRARRRLGEKSYNLLSNNCEHFAYSCKTGMKKSSQVETVKQTLKRIGHQVACIVSGRVALKALNEAFSSGPQGLKQVGQAGIAALQMGAGQLMKGRNPYLAGAAIVTLKPPNNLKENREAYNNGHIPREAYIQGNIKHITGTALGLAGAAAGAAIGYFILPIPVVGPLIGATLGKCLGHLLSPMVGKKIIGKMKHKRRY